MVRGGGGDGCTASLVRQRCISLYITHSPVLGSGLSGLDLNEDMYI